MLTMKYSINLDRNKDKDIDKEWLNELKKDLILKTVRIDNEIKNSKDYVCRFELKKIMGNLFKSIESIKELEEYLKDN
ncbi:MAG: hypothetical protein E7H33_09625 [Clostridium perfringens]|nr:hypothetical protein [Clostridium perfringens]